LLGLPIKTPVAGAVFRRAHRGWAVWARIGRQRSPHHRRRPGWQRTRGGLAI